ncbi:hypothetical protein [Streptomyces olivochromogenes]|uniref:hypothetical protein n=1 Tax=Streptomyces olivochromogenes TaxID=1963 RepID=UPI001F209555|nr:hypothetical protein [Streptomyces olivochromogenes]MCF3137075.1 hypothetical protein [Streptomyces olivochromogenes]
MVGTDSGPLRVPDNGDVGRAGSSWYQRLNAHVAHLQGQLNKFVKIRRADPGGMNSWDVEVAHKIHLHLKAARDALKTPGWRGWCSRMRGASADRALANVHEAEVALLRIAPDAEIYTKGLYALSQARIHLPRDDTCTRRLKDALTRTKSTEADAGLRELAALTLHAAYQAEEAERARLRSFTQIVVVAAGALAVIAVGLGVWAGFDPEVSRRFCFAPDEKSPNSDLICPLGSPNKWGNVFFLEFIGMCGAAVAGAVSLRDVRGTAGPYHVATGQMILRLPVGAVAAAVGILLMSGAFFPGLSSLDTSTQIVAWGFAFGILQESVTRAVDRQGRSLLDNIKGPGSGPTGPDPPEAPPAG